MRKVKLTLGKGTAAALRNELEQEKRDLASKCDEICRRLAELGLQTAKTLVPVDTGMLQSSIEVVRRGTSDYLIVAGSDYAAFVEFGTGVVGSGTYSYELPEGWEYLEDPPRSPWAHDPEDVSIWYYVDESGAVRSTRGQAASGYMGGAAAKVHQQALTIAKEVLQR